MSSASLFQRLRGPFNFLEPREESIRLLFPDAGKLLPMPRHIYLEDERSTPVFGFPVARSPEVALLGKSLRVYIESEERAQLATLRRTAFNIPAHQACWEDYRSRLQSLAGNVTRSSYGRSFPQVFWLYHSLDLISALKGTSGRLRQLDLEAGRDQGDEIRYKILNKYLDRVFHFLYDLSSRLAKETQQGEAEVFPPLLVQMRDNVLILTEDHIGKDLTELKSYFRGYLRVNGSDLLYRLALLRRWYTEAASTDPRLEAAASHLVGGPANSTVERILLHPGYLSYLSSHPAYDHATLLGEDEIRLWEGLLIKLKEFELFHAVRRLMVEVEPRAGRLWCGARGANRLGAGSEPIVLNPETRPLDFAARWIVDPEVHRGGLIYDLVDFSSSVSSLRMSDPSDQDDSFRQIFLFQRQIGELADELRLRMEKYLGDGAFFSGRHPRRLLIAALLVQRAYGTALEAGFPFNRGLRIALNFGSYRLLPLGTATGEVYEAFGHGLVELSRLVSGKRRLDLEDIKRTLLIKGYRDDAVHDFFAPLAAGDRGALKSDRTFFADLDADGGLINHGIVVTEAFLHELQRTEKPLELYDVEQDSFGYIAFRLSREDGAEYPFGVRRLGLASLKGLDKINVYEVVDGNSWPLLNLAPMPGGNLLESLRESFTSSVARG